MRRPRLGIRGSGLGTLLGVGFVALAGAAETDANSTNGLERTELQITVRVQDYAGVPRKTLAQAEREASVMLEDTGVKFTWADCPVGGPATDPVCTQPFRATDLALRILPQGMVARAPLSGDALGFAVISTDYRPSLLASVFYHRIEDLSNALGYSRAATLGYVMAHEIGHLLLRTSGHSPFGIMRARLTRDDLLRPLRFNADQADLIRADVRARNESDSAARIAAAAPQ